MPPASPELKKQVRDFVDKRIKEILEWYFGPDSGVIDCEETRKNINRDLQSILRETESHFKLKPLKGRLCIRSEKGNPRVVRYEKPGWN